MYYFFLFALLSEGKNYYPLKLQRLIKIVSNRANLQTMLELGLEETAIAQIQPDIPTTLLAPRVTRIVKKTNNAKLVTSTSRISAIVKIRILKFTLLVFGIGSFIHSVTNNQLTRIRFDLLKCTQEFHRNHSSKLHEVRVPPISLSFRGFGDLDSEVLRNLELNKIHVLNCKKEKRQFAGFWLQRLNPLIPNLPALNLVFSLIVKPTSVNHYFNSATKQLYVAKKQFLLMQRRRNALYGNMQNTLQFGLKLKLENSPRESNLSRLRSAVDSGRRSLDDRKRYYSKLRYVYSHILEEIAAKNSTFAHNIKEIIAEPESQNSENNNWSPLTESTVESLILQIKRITMIVHYHRANLIAIIPGL